MAPFLMVSVAVIGLPADSVLIAYGLAFDSQQDNNTMALGIGMHLLVGALIGTIFGGITSIVNRLRVTGIGRGIAGGLVTGVIAFVLLFVPLWMFVIPPFLVEIFLAEASSMDQGQAMDMLQEAMPVLFGLAFADHLIYGAVLGTVMTAFVVGVRKKSKEEQGPKEHLQQSEGQLYLCQACKRQFATARELEEHRQTAHFSDAAA